MPRAVPLLTWRRPREPTLTRPPSRSELLELANLGTITDMLALKPSLSACLPAGRPACCRLLFVGSTASRVDSAGHMLTRFLEAGS